MSRRWAGAGLGLVMLAAGCNAAASAPEADPQKRAGRPDAGAAARQAPRTAPAPKVRDAQGKPWSIEDALPKGSKALSPAAEASSGSGPGLGRVRAGQGSFGFETETKVKSNETPDGTRIPGPVTGTQHQSQYLGLSLSLPTSNKTMGIPLPATSP